MRLLNLTDAKDYQVWEAGLSDMPEAALRMGLHKARDFKGFFTLGEFRELCRITPQDLGLPDTRSAMLEACNAPYPKDQHTWSHPAVYLAGNAVGWFDVQHLTERELFPIFDNAYTQLVHRVLNGEQLSLPIRKALPKEVHVPADPEKGREALRRLKEMFA